MSDDKSSKGDRQNDASTSGDTEEELQNELKREAAEGKGAVGDLAKNSNLDGSSTWETLPESDDKS